MLVQEKGSYAAGSSFILVYFHGCQEVAWQLLVAYQLTTLVSELIQLSVIAIRCVQMYIAIYTCIPTYILFSLQSCMQKFIGFFFFSVRAAIGANINIERATAVYIHYIATKIKFKNKTQKKGQLNKAAIRTVLTKVFNQKPLYE